MDLRDKTVLLVEDEVMIALLEKRWLVKEGYKVVHVTSGEKAIETVNANPNLANIILMDIDLGSGIDGTEAAREILKKYDIPLLFLSSHTEPELVKKTEEISSYGYVLKGSSETVLLASIRMAFKLFHAKMGLKENADIIEAERQKAEQYLDVVEVMLIALDSEGKITLVNRKGCQVLGYSENELIGKNWAETCLVPEESETLLGYFKYIITGGLQSFEYHENNVVTKSGEKRLIAWHNSLLTDKSGKITGTLSSGEDITEARKAEISLRESEQNFRQLVDNMGEGIGFVDHNETFIFANRSGEEIFGVDPGKLVGRNLSEFHTPVELELVLTETEKRRQGLRSVYQSEIILDNGQRKTLVVTATPRFSHEGEFLGTFGIFRDITEKKKSLEKLKESEHRLSDMAKNIPGIVYQYCIREDGTSYFSYLSEKAAELLGLTLGSELHEWNFHALVPEADRKRLSESIDKAVKTGSIWEYEGQFICRDGKFRWFEGKALPAKSDKELVYNGIFIDITKRKNAELLMQKYSEKLRQSNVTKDKFFSILAHDLKGPFSGFMGLTEDMVNNLESLDKYEISEYANVMLSTSKKIYELLNNLLEWSRLQTEKINITLERLNLFEKVYDIQTLFFTAAAKKSIQINNIISKDIFITADSNSLSTILRNLISNSVKFTPTGGIITISSKESEKFAEIKISDSGIGMTAEVLERTFRIDSGYTTKGTNGEEGTGLGLIICKEIAVKNKWELEAASRIGKGTEFTIRVPLTSK